MSVFSIQGSSGEGPSGPGSSERARAGVECGTSITHRSWFRDLVVIAVAVGTALAIWAAGSGLGARPLIARTGPEQLQEVGPVMVGVAAAMAALAGVATLRLALARLRSGRRWWTAVGITVLLVSLLGTTGATTLSGGLVLAALHLQVGLTVLLGLRRVHRVAGRA